MELVGFTLLVCMRFRVLWLVGFSLVVAFSFLWDGQVLRGCCGICGSGLVCAVCCG